MVGSNKLSRFSVKLMRLEHIELTVVGFRGISDSFPALLFAARAILPGNGEFHVF
jgi:hypothetical protein